MTLAHAIIGMAVSAVIGGVLAIIFKPGYDAEAEKLEIYAAQRAQALADKFQKIANELRAPGK